MMKIRTPSTPGLMSLFLKTAWVLTLVVLMSTPSLTEEIDEYSEQQGQIPDFSLTEFLEALKDLAERAPQEAPSDPSEDDQMMNSRVRKSGTSRPKFDPGYKWIGLGKRPSVPIGPHIAGDLRHFFETARNKLANEYMESQINGDTKQDGRVNDETLKFVHRSKESGTRKSNYNPSLLWTGLGR